MVLLIILLALMIVFNISAISIIKKQIEVINFHSEIYENINDRIQIIEKLSSAELKKFKNQCDNLKKLFTKV